MPTVLSDTEAVDGIWQNEGFARRSHSDEFTAFPCSARFIKFSPLLTSVTYLSLSVPALYLEIRAMDKGTDRVSSQRFSYFGSLAMGEEGDDGACVKEARVSRHRTSQNTALWRGL